MARSLSKTGLLCLAVALAGCDGRIFSPSAGRSPGGTSSGDPNPGGDPPPVQTTPGQAAAPLFSCDPTQVPDELALPRLSHAQISGAFQSAIRQANSTDADAIWSAVADTFSHFPADAITPAPGDVKGGFGRTDQQIQQTQIDALYDIATAIAAQLTASTARMTALMGTCATNASKTDDAQCLNQFVSTWGARVLRAPLSADDVTFYTGIAGTTPVDPAAVADVIATLLQSPEFVYRVEHGTQDSQPVSTLSAYELASRLSLQLWQQPPDDALWAVAADGSLLTDATFFAQVDRLVSDPQALSAADELVTQWLRLDELPAFDALDNDPVFKAFAGADLPNAGTRDAMIADLLGSFHAKINDGGSLSGFLTDTTSYTASTSPSFSTTGRAGLITRAAMLATGTATTRPIHKGYLTRNALLCQQIGAPPANVNLTPPAPGSNETTRQAVTRITGSGVCSGCHTYLINPSGFVTEGFDALGRVRTVENVYDASGSITASLPIDTSAVPGLTAGDTRMVSDPLTLTQMIDTSKLYQSCFARRYFRFSQSRNEDAVKDGCVLQSLEAAARADAPLTGVFKAAALASSFKTRRFE